MRRLHTVLVVVIVLFAPRIASAACVPDKVPEKGWANLRTVLKCIEDTAAAEIKRVEAKTVPPGTIAFFLSPDCPEDFGWTRADELTGRYVVGLDPRHRKDAGAPVGKPLDNKEARAAGAHRHSFSEIGLADKGNINEGLRTEWFAGSNVRLNKNTAQTQPAPRDAGDTNAPYIQLSACEKK